MILVEKNWDESLANVKYGEGYDIRLHAAQVALNVIDRRSQVTGARMNEINFSSVKFGYYDVHTEQALREFQLAVGIPTTGVLDKLTYQYLFMVLRRELNVVIVETKNKTLKIYEITKDMEGLLPEYDFGTNESDDDFNGSGEDEGSSWLPNFGFNWGDDGGYNDDPYKDLNYKDWNTSYMDGFWDSLKDKVDDFFGIGTGKTPDLGNGGMSWNGNWNTGSKPDGSWDGNWNTGGGPSHPSVVPPSNNGGGVTFVDGLLANSIYKGNFDYSKPVSWVSKSQMDINVDGYQYENSEKYDTFFSAKNTSDTRKSNYDITIVYGPNGRFAKKIVDVRPRGKSQQVDASGEAIFEVIDFIAKDIIETDNIRRK